MQMPIVCPGCFPCSLPLEKIRYVYRKKQIFHNVRQFITRFFFKKNNKFQGINQDIDNITLYVLQTSKKT